MTRTAQNVSFRFNVPWDQRIGAQFSLRYSIENASLIVSVQDVLEQPGFEMIEVGLANLASARASEDCAWMAQGRDGGSFVRVAQAKPFKFPDEDYFGRISTQLPVGMVGVGGIGCAIEVSAFMDGAETVVTVVSGERRARIGTVQVYRVHGGRCYNMNDGGDGVCGTKDTPNLLVGQESRCRLDFFKVEDRAAPWFPAAKLLRDRMPRNPTNYFDDKFVYMIAGRLKKEPQPRTTFSQSDVLIRDGCSVDGLRASVGVHQRMGVQRAGHGIPVGRCGE